MACSANENRLILKAGRTRAVFSEEGRLLELQAGKKTLPCGGLTVDAGAGGAWAGNSFVFQSFLDFNTWSLPEISPTGEAYRGKALSCTCENDYLTCASSCGPVELRQIRREDCGTLRLDAAVKNTSGEKLWINGVSFALRLASGGISFDFPGNVPCGVFDAGSLRGKKPVETGLVTAVTHFSCPDGDLNVIFIDPEEKWGTGVYAEDGSTVWTAIAAAELCLEPGGEFHCGSLYLQPLENEERFEPIRRLYREKGWRVPSDGIRDAVVYSGHPSGPWDANFPFHTTMEEYASYTETIVKMGFDTIWLLPIFDHREEADPERYLYAPADQSRIDPRYGDDEAVRRYVENARRLGARIIFDYVPHGPRPQDPLGKRYLDIWASKRQDGSPQMEWSCLSFDMANPGYLAYMKELVKDHIRRFGIEGTRIDCAMGGLSNWEPYPGNRPSSSNMRGGVSMAHALREAFSEEGVTPFVTPENFHPIPLYAGCTDAYYDMALYRVLYDLNRAGLSPKAYVFELTRWLEHQMLSMPEGMQKLRFLGNHDTVSWVWDAKRPTAVYGTERAKAMWVLIALIDGCPMIYQGDEDPKIYLDETGPNLTEFFAELFAAKNKYTSHAYETRYEYTGTGLFAFRRAKGDDEKLVLINFEEEPACYPLEKGGLLYGDAVLSEGRAELPPNGYAMLQL